MDCFITNFTKQYLQFQEIESPIQENGTLVFNLSITSSV